MWTQKLLVTNLIRMLLTVDTTDGVDEDNKCKHTIVFDICGFGLEASDISGFVINQLL